jgi:hypothetical protein
MVSLEMDASWDFSESDMASRMAGEAKVGVEMELRDLQAAGEGIARRTQPERTMGSGGAVGCTREFFYVRNYEPDRWPAGNPETGYRNCDPGPTKEFLLSGFDEYYRMSFGKRPAEELYHVASDPDCVKNLATDLKFAAVKRELRQRMDALLHEEGDPRALGHAEFFETIQYTGPRRHAYDTWLRNQ